MDNSEWQPGENDTVSAFPCDKCGQIITQPLSSSQAHNCTPHINPETGLPWGLKFSTKSPKKNCKKCHGRGHIGYINGDMTQPYKCQCTIEIVVDEPEPYKEKTATQPASEGMAIPAPEPNYTTNELPKSPSA